MAMKTTHHPKVILGLVLVLFLSVGANAATVIADNYNVIGSGSGFASGSGVNTGINPPTTRMTGSAAANLRYISTGTKAATAYTITNKLQVAAAASPGRFVLSADGATPFSFASALGTGAATPTNPVVYDIGISMKNSSAGAQRFSFALGTAEGDANTWDFGVQVYRASSGDSFYTIGKRIDTGSSGLGADLNEAILAMTPNTYGMELDVLMRVTDAGAETATFNSRVQLSLNGGNSWFYDTATDPDLVATGWRLNGPERIIMWDVAPDAGPVTYDRFSVKVNPPLNNANTSAVFRVMAYNIHWAAGPDGEVNTQRIADFILGQDVDLVAFNEVARFWPLRANGRDIIGEIALQTGMAFVFSNNNTALTGNDQFGNAILSKYPILFRDHRLLPRVGDNEQRGWLKAVVDVNGKFLSFTTTHLDFKADHTERLMCVTNFNNWLADETLPVILAGDFNDTPDSPMYDRMELKWADVWPVAGDGSLGRTVPCPGPPFNARIDYIWKTKTSQLTPTNAEVGYSIEASDHYPVLTQFILNSATNHVSGFYFPFDQGSGSKVTDAVSGLSGNFTTGAASWSSDSPTGQTNDFSLYFNGARKITVIDTNQIIGTNGLNDDYTLQAWVKLPLYYAPAERAVLFQYERRPGFSFSIDTNRTLHTTAFKHRDIASTATIPNDGEWHHVAIVHTTGADMKFYVDAVLAATVAYTNGAGQRTSSTLTIGAASEGANWFTGHLDRIRYDQRALLPAEFDRSTGPGGGFEAWMIFYQITDSTGDEDGDGQNNQAEYLANTNPTNSASVFKILSGTRQATGQFDLTWASVGGKRYRIQYLDGDETGGVTGEFIEVIRDIASETDASSNGISSTQTFTDPASNALTNGSRFYRIKIVP
jgi:endonuclease/exonuclease/phosphatase family metal-dependent hydrolase